MLVMVLLGLFGAACALIGLYRRTFRAMMLWLLAPLWASYAINHYTGSLILAVFWTGSIFGDYAHDQRKLRQRVRS